MAEGKKLSKKTQEQQLEAMHAILQRIASDPDFREQIQNNPEQALRDAGLDDDAIQALQSYQPSGVEGQRKCSWTCFFGDWGTTQASWSYDC